MSSPPTDLATNLARVRERIERAAARKGRSGGEITLVAVSKMHPAAQIRELYQAGIRHFGENRVQEWESKFGSLSDLNATWHMIGHLQSNKAARALRLFHAIDSVDSLTLAERLDRGEKDSNTDGTETTETTEKTTGGVASGGRLPVLIEIKLDPNETKSGVSGEELPRLVDAISSMPHLELRGLMGVPPYFGDPEEARPYFRRLRELRDATRSRLGSEVLPVLSMGMSHDFEIAIEEGATEVRIGTALFGKRQKE